MGEEVLGQKRGNPLWIPAFLTHPKKIGPTSRKSQEMARRNNLGQSVTRMERISNHGPSLTFCPSFRYLLRSTISHPRNLPKAVMTYVIASQTSLFLCQCTLSCLSFWSGSGRRQAKLCNRLKKIGWLAGKTEFTRPSDVEPKTSWANDNIWLSINYQIDSQEKGGATPNMLEFSIWGWGKWGKVRKNGANLKLRNSCSEKTSRSIIHLDC